MNVDNIDHYFCVQMTRDEAIDFETEKVYFTLMRRVSVIVCSIGRLYTFYTSGRNVLFDLDCIDLQAHAHCGDPRSRFSPVGRHIMSYAGGK